MTALTTHDKSVLRALFDPEASLSKNVEIKSSLPSSPYYTEQQFAKIRDGEISIMRPLRNSSVDPAIIASVIEDLSTLIQIYPAYASAYINCAQATRLLIPTDDIFAPKYSTASGQLLEVLGKGIKLATPKSTKQAVSNHQSNVLAAGHTHRGFLLLKIAKRIRNGQSVEGAGAQLRSMTAEQVEEIASNDFAAGGRYGNKMAQQMSIRTNPYAKMCGDIVKEAMRKEMEEATFDQMDMKLQILDTV